MLIAGRVFGFQEIVLQVPVGARSVAAVDIIQSAGVPDV